MSKIAIQGNASGSGTITLQAPDTNTNRTILLPDADGILGGVPTGAVLPFAMSTAPNGWLECDGSAISRTTYADLFAALGTLYGAGDGSTTFNLPDLRGEFIRGWDNGKGTDTGRTIGSSQTDELKAHTHTFSNEGAIALSSTTGAQTAVASTSETSSNTSSVGGTETRPRNIAMMYCVKA